MKKNYLFATILLVILLLISCIPNSVYAGYDENSMAKKQVSENNIKLTKIIEYTDSNKTSNIDNQTIIKIPFEEIEHTDFNEIKQIMKEKNASVLIGYKTLPLLLEKISTCNINIDIRAINEMIENEDEFIKKYNENGLMDLRLEDDNQLYPGGFFTKAYRDDNIIRNYNIFKGYITMDIVEGTEKITEKPTPRFIKGNYELRFYWSDSTSFNKLYVYNI